MTSIAEGSGFAGAPASHCALVASLLERLRVRDPDGSAVQATGAGERAADLVVDTLLDPSTEWTEQLGTFHDAAGVAELLGTGGRPISRQAVSKRAGLLALRTGNGRVVYPAFQFRGRTPIPALAAVLAVLPEDVVSRWTVAAWLSAPEPELDGRTPAETLHARHLFLPRPPLRRLGGGVPIGAGGGRRGRPPAPPVPGDAAGDAAAGRSGRGDRLPVRGHGGDPTLAHYALPRRWAAAVHTAGFDGLVGTCRHDPTSRTADVAVFGPAGTPSRRVGWTARSTRLDEDAVTPAEIAAFGVRVRPAPYDVPITPVDPTF